MTPTSCTYRQLCLMPFTDGTFPGWIDRDQYGDKAIRADDMPLAKFDPFGHVPASGYAWGTWIPAPVAPQITAASLAGPQPTQPTPWHPVTPSQPWWPDFPDDTDGPCCIIITPPIEPELPQPAPVPLEASGLFLLTGLAALWWWGRK